ncbi:N-acetylaspartate synthetase [Crotalus adamanteus]|uniref:N-acetylaspartate synthetase n=1 Tax=Crotalus adamanteus TaxID=8729 RepID=A0AAW1BIH5_CROAD
MYWHTRCSGSRKGSCFWVAVLNGNVVGIVAARGNEEDNTVELRRMSVDSKYRGKGIAKALGRKVLEFAVVNNYSSVVLGTTAVKVAAHKLPAAAPSLPRKGTNDGRRASSLLPSQAWGTLDHGGSSG